MRRLALCLTFLLAACVHKPPETPVKKQGFVGADSFITVPQECGAVPCPNPTEPPARQKKMKRAGACRGSFKSCCSHHDGIDPRRIDDGTGHIKCITGDDYPKKDACSCVPG